MTVPSLRATALALLCAAPIPAGARNVLAVLPLDDLAGRPSAAQDLQALADHHATVHGWDVVLAGSVERALEASRVRYLDSLSGPALEKLLADLGADAVLVGTLLSFADGASPSVAVSARLVVPGGGVAWSGMQGLAAAETVGALGLGGTKTTAELLERAAARLFDSFPRPSQVEAGAGAAPLARRRAPLWGGPAAWRDPAFDPRLPRRVSVLPFENFGKRADAPRMLADLASRRLAGAGRFTVVGAADLRAAMVAEEVRSFGRADAAQLLKLARRLTSPLFLRGTVYAYDELLGAAGPVVDLQLSLVDAEAGRVVWTARLARSGGDYAGLLQRGALTTAGALADQLLAEVFDTLSTRWQAREE